MSRALSRREESTALPYARLNLRRNPFGELSLDERAELAVADVAEYVRQLRQPPFAVQFLGDKGRGKTTHLLAIRSQFPGAAYLHSAEGERPRMPRGWPLLIDEVQRLPRWRRWLVFRRNRSLVLGSHEDVSGELRRSGFRVVSVDVERLLDVERLERMLNVRIERSRRAPGPLPTVPRRTAEVLMRRFGSDIRAMEAQLYDTLQELCQVCDVEV